jgi:hypothetical protein
MTLVSSAIIMGSDKELYSEERSLTYITNSKGPINDHWRTPCFNVTQSDKKLCFTGRYYFNFLLLLLLLLVTRRLDNIHRREKKKRST